jgi:signal transduction histidine kinase
MYIGHIQGFHSMISGGILLVVLSVLVVVSLLWRHKERPGINFLIILMILSGLYSVPYGYELIAESFETKVFWGKMTYLGGAFLPMTFFLFSHRFSQRKFPITRKLIVALSIIPLFTIIFSFTNELHWFYWKNVSYFRDTTLVNYDHGPGFWVYYIYCQVLVMAGITNLFIALVRFPKIYATHVVFILISALIPTIANLMYVFGLNIAPGYDLTPPAFMISVVLISIGVLHLKMFDIVPIARNTLVDILTDGIVVINDKLIIEDFNPASRNFFKKPEVLRVGNKIDEVIIERAPWMDNLDLTAKSTIEHTVVIGGTERTIEIEINPLVTANNQHSGNLILLRDISRQKENMKDLQAMNQQLNQEIEIRGRLIEDLDSFAHTVAHDIKSNLSGIVSGHSMLNDLMNSGEFELFEETSRLIQQTALKTLHITGELLMLATLGEEDIRVIPLEMDKIIRSAITRLNESAEPGSFILHIADKLPDSVGHAPWIEEVWYNYLSNGVKYGGTPAVLEIGGEVTAEETVKYWIKDQGDGIDQEKIPLLFTKFSRLRPERVDGTGLGLSIVKRIVEKLGGSVGAESSGIEGEGALFYFTLPALSENIHQNITCETEAFNPVTLS